MNKLSGTFIKSINSFVFTKIDGNVIIIIGTHHVSIIHNTQYIWLPNSFRESAQIAEKSGSSGGGGEGLLAGGSSASTPCSWY